MLDEKRLNEMPQNVSEIWKKLLEYVRTKYVMDEVWDRETLKFKKSGRTVFSLSLKPRTVEACIIFGQKEREKFEERYEDFSERVQQIYNISTTYHDGKWLFFDIYSVEFLKEIVKLIKIKKKPNRKLTDDVGNII
jgi:hypothetical protein